LKQTKEGAIKQIGKVQLNDLRVEHLREIVCDEDAYFFSVTVDLGNIKKTPFGGFFG
jgi:hypothetical protein